MSLFSSIQMAGNTLRANQIALQVVGQNIANANTPGYIREDILLTPAPTQRDGGVLLGMGVEVSAVVQKIDAFLEERLRGAVSDSASSQTTQQTYSQLEGLIGELSGTDLSSSMNSFFSSISEVLNQPEDRSVRNLAVLQGEALTQNIRQLAERTVSLRNDVNTQIQDMGGQINNLIEQVRSLNVRITQITGGDITKSDAVGLNDQRSQALEELAQLIDIQTIEQPDGSVTVYAGGDYLVSEGQSRPVEVVLESEGGMVKANIDLAETGAALNPASGQLRGLLDSRDQILSGFLDKLDNYAQTLAFEFNKVYASGQGLVGYQQASSEFTVDDPDKALNAAGLKFTPANGSFQVLIYNKTTQLTQTTDVTVDLNGVGHDTTLTDLANALNQISGLHAEVSTSRGLVIRSESSDQDFAFADDTSGVLAALGLNTFFSGSSARDIGVSQAVQGDPALFAASRGGIGADTDTAVELAAFLDRPLASQNGASIGVIYNRMVDETTQNASIAQADADGAGTFETSLRSQKMAVSGVSLDEEAVKMIGYQQAYQASAKYISVLSQLFDILLQM